MLGLTQSTQAKSTEKLSSGYKINRAADDAAGLSISEKMRKQMRGLTQASANAQDGISSVQTAEGALTEVHDMLQRMNELAVKAANGTMSENDRSYVQNEIDQLVTELDRVSETTKFNETYLLKGNAEGTTSEHLVNAHDAGLDGKLVDNGDGTATFSLKKALEDGDKVTIAGKNYTIGSKETTTDGFMASVELSTKKMSVGDSYSFTSTDGTSYTKTLVDKAENTSANLVSTAVKSIKIGDQDYEIAASTNLSANELSAADAQKLVADALAEGKEASITKLADAASGIYDASADVNIQLVTSVDADTEISSYKVGAQLGDGAGGKISVGQVGTPAVSGDTFGKGDVVSIAGESFTATANKPANMETLKTVVKSLENDDKVKIGSTTYTIADETKIDGADNSKITKDDLLALMNDRDDIAIKADSAEGKAAMLVAKLENNANIASPTATYTAVVNTKANADDNVLSVKDAYKMMSEELQKASSIGTDKAAEVKSNNSGDFTITKGTVEYADKLNFNLHVGADADMTNKIMVDVDSMSAAGLGVKGINVKDTTGISATYAIDAIEDAIQKVSTQRSALGAVQNRLEHTINNLDNVVENTTAAESAIRDTDMANEMVKYSNDNILAQAGQAMLAQANQSNQGVLSLLQ
jgi:flagellin-like hook-associated protein FlgL